MKTHHVLVALLGAAALCGQRTWIVDESGSGDFKDIPPAVIAASPGDTILVKPGNNYFAPSTNKPLRIMCSSSSIPPRGTLRIHDLPPGTEFVLAGPFGVPLHRDNLQIHLRNNRGRVHISGVRQTQGAVSQQVVAYTTIEDCDDVSINLCHPMHAVTIRNSNVLITHSGIAGNSATAAWQATPTPGVTMENAHVVLAGCDVNGGLNLVGTTAYPGIAMQGGTLVLTGTPNEWVWGRVSARNSPSPIHSDGGTVTIDPDIQLFEGTGALASPTGTSTYLYRELPFVRTRHAIQGGSFDPTVHGNPGALAGLLVAAPVRPLPLPPFGDLWLDPATLIPLGAGTLTGTGADGTWTLSAPVGNQVFPSGTILAFQAAVLDGGALGLSQPTRAIVSATSLK